MRNRLLFSITLLLLYTTTFAQITTERSNEPVFFKVKSHDTNIRELPGKSFYESKVDWQYIIDTTWGPGLPLQNKQNVFNHFSDLLVEEFDGFESLNFSLSTWDSLRNHYYTKIDSNTSKGRFSAIMFHFTRQLSDLHTWAYNIEVVETALNPGIPLLVVGGFCNIEHFGAVLSALEDSTIFVLRAVINHPLGLETGDIILGYNGELWVNIIQELLEAELPGNGAGSIKNGGTTNSQSSITHNLLICAGMNWHLFDTIDIVKYSTGDTLHLSVSALLNLNVPPMLNNEQLEISNIPFPDYFNNEAVSYGILPNTNIGYIYVCSEAIPTYASANQQFNSAVLAMQDVDALIIDMRWNEGGNAFWQDAFGYWTNEIVYTLEWAFRCNTTDFTLCFDGDTVLSSLQGQPPGKYQRPIAVLLGPICKSMGDINAYRLSYLDNVKTFGKSTAAGLGWNALWQGYQGFNLRWSKADIAHISNPTYFLNRKEFPIDFSVWHNPDEAAQGKDAVVEAALDWMNNLVYGHLVTTDSSHYTPGNGVVNVSATIENPNSNNVTARVYIENLENTFIDSIDLVSTESSEVWQGEWIVPNIEDVYKLNIKAIDNTFGESFTFSNMQRFTTAGPIILTDYYFTSQDTTPGAGDLMRCKISLKNQSSTFTVPDVNATIVCDDTLVTITSALFTFGNLPPGEEKEGSGLLMFELDENCPNNYTISFGVSIKSEGWDYWLEDFDIVTGVNDIEQIPSEFSLEQNFPNPFNNSTIIKYSIPLEGLVTLKVYNLLGEEVARLVNDIKLTGNYEVSFDATGLPSGIYFYRLQAGSFVETKKMILLK